MSVSVGLQLYTLRGETARDFPGTLARVAGLGFAGVEFAGYGDFAAGDLRRLLRDLGLRAAASHVSLERLRLSLDAELDYAEEIGALALVCPWADPGTPLEWLTIAEQLNLAAQACQARGLRLAYHNHAHELTGRVGELPTLDALLTRAPQLDCELDVAWTHAGGADPVAYLQEYAPRVPLVHLKDVRRKGPGNGMDAWDTVELGAGEVDLRAVLNAAGEARWWLVEQDHSADPWASLDVSVRFLRKQGVLTSV